MTPASVLAGIPADLIRRHTSPNEQIQTAKALAAWLDQRGHRPTLLEIEQERAKRTVTQATVTR
jgi:hypothetical protein